MATTHGNKLYFQLLLDPGRGQLLQEIADKKGVRPTALARQVLYEWLSCMADSTEFRKAEELDAAMWQQSVRNRVAGRMNSRASSDLSTTAA